MMGDIKLVPATVDDIADIAKCACRAFADDALEKAICPVSEATPGSSPNFELRVQRIGKALPSPEWHYVVATINPQDAPRRIVGFAAWKAPQPGTGQEQTPVDPDDGHLPRGVDAGAAQYAIEAVEKAKKTYLDNKDKDMWYLASLGVDPAFQGRRIASRLVRWGLELADKEFQAAYLVSSPAAFGVYQRLGFEEVAKMSIIKDHEGDLATLMERPPIEPYRQW